MKIQRGLLGLSAITILFMVSCQSGSHKKVANLAPNAHQVTAEEVIQTSSYTYVRVVADDRDYWIATTKMAINEGGTYFWSQGVEMNNFTSKELNRTFPSIFFVQDFTDQPIIHSQPTQQGQPMQEAQPSETMAGKQVPQQTSINVQKAAGGITISDLYAKRSSYAGKIVKIRGQVVKFSPGIMGKNWMHLQDGTKDGNNYDLTVTSQGTVMVGDVVTVEGKVAVDKDFGAGYFYPVIVEDAAVMK
jgi:hypothetical protein